MNATQPITIVLERVIGNANVLLPAGEKLTHDDRLCALAAGVGQVATLLRSPSALRVCLERVAAYALGWLAATQDDGGTEFYDRSIQIIIAERERQKQLFKDGEIEFDCSKPIVDDRRKLRMLVEELGEVAEAVDRVEQLSAFLNVGRRVRSSQAVEHLRAELSQVAAVSVAWLESFEVKP